MCKHVLHGKTGADRYSKTPCYCFIFFLGCCGFNCYLHPLLAEEICCCVQDISCVTGVVVRVTGVVIGLNHLQPGAQSGLGAVQELTNPKPGEDLQAQVS